MNEKFDKKKYDMNLRKEKKKQFNVDLNIDEKEEIDNFLKEHKIQKVEFVRNAFARLKEELKMKNYVVTIESENFQKKGSNRYHYQCLTDKFDNVYFENFEDAKEYVDNYNLECDKQAYSLYLDFLSVFKYNEDDEEIVGENLYNRGFNYQEIEEKYNIKLEF